MEERDKEINEIAQKYTEMLYNLQLPEMKVEDLLDLTDYYSRNGMDFEAELFKRIAVLKFPDNPDVILMCAHWEADEGNWNGVNNICSMMQGTTYDNTLFQMEKLLRMMMPQDAYEQMQLTLSPLMETEDHDFLFDAAELFRDFGYLKYALRCLKKIPSTYADYRQVLELSAECFFFDTDFDASLQQLDKAIDNNPFDDYLWAQTGMLHYRKGDYSKALDACEYSLAILKDNARAQHMKNILVWKKDPKFDLSEAPYLRQDYGAMVEVGDLHYANGEYKKAEAEYMGAGYFCPRGNRDRIQITFKTACCRMMSGRMIEGIQTFLSSINQGFDLWPYAMEILQILFREEQHTYITPLLLPIMKLDTIAMTRLSHLITEFTSYTCYKDAKDIWNIIIARMDEFPPVYQVMIELAKQKLDEEEEENDENDDNEVM